MAAINLLPRQLREDARYPRIRHLAYSVSTIALTMYVVAAAAALGWWLFLSQTESHITEEVATATTQLKQLSASEQLVRQLDQKGKMMQQFLQDRPQTATIAAALSPNTHQVSIVSWNFQVGGKQLLVISSSRVLDIEQYAASLKPVFPNVNIDKLDRQSPSVWAAQISL